MDYWEVLFAKKYYILNFKNLMCIKMYTTVINPYFEFR